MDLVIDEQLHAAAVLGRGPNPVEFGRERSAAQAQKLARFAGFQGAERAEAKLDKFSRSRR